MKTTKESMIQLQMWSREELEDRRHKMEKLIQELKELKQRNQHYEDGELVKRRKTYRWPLLRTRNILEAEIQSRLVAQRGQKYKNFLCKSIIQKEEKQNLGNLR